MSFASPPSAFYRQMYYFYLEILAPHPVGFAPLARQPPTSKPSLPKMEQSAPS
jgi:hypothetical protein